MNKPWLIWGAVLALAAVALGAMGDHLVRPKLEVWFPDSSGKRLENWEVAGRYLMYHALAICLLGLLPATVPGRGVQWAGALFTAGVLLFSGGLFGLALSGERWLAHVVPFGGLAMLSGWIVLIAVLARSRTP